MDENSSAFIRVSQGMAGGQYGIMFLPRVGQEVVVDFLEGNPDRPLIVGRVFNGDLMPPYPLPEQATKSVIKTHTSKGGGGCNEIRFEDAKGQEQLLIQAQSRMDTKVKGGHFHSNGGYDLTVGGEKDGQRHGDYKQIVFMEKHTHVKGLRQMYIEGDENYGVDGMQYVHVMGNRLHMCDGNVHDKFASGHMHECTGYHLSSGSIKIEATTGIELTCGGSSIVILPGEIYITAGTVYINSGAGPGMESGVSVAQPTGVIKDPAAAQSTKPGRDKRYDGIDVPVPPIEPPELEKRKTFVQIKVVDASPEQKPVANELVRVRLPDGSTKDATTDAQGIVRFDDIDPGMAEFQLPNRQDPEWRFLRIEPAAG
jgi:type VI secretion system secreted protein VgrG